MSINLTAVIDNEEAIRKLNELKSAAKNTTSSIVTDTDRVDAAIAKFTRTLGTVGLGVSFGAIAKQVAQVRGEFQQLEVAFNTMLQSEEKASALMSQLTRTAATTPFGLQDVASGAKQLLAYGTEADKVNETLIRLGDIAAGLSIPLGDLVYLYGTTMTQGRLYTQDFNQFLGRGIPIAEELAKQFGVTKAQVKELVTEGKIGFEQIQKAIVSMTNEGGKFGGLMENQSKTIVGQISNLEDAIDMMLNDIGKSSQGAISGAIRITSTLVENYEKVADVLAVLVSTYGAYRTALILTAASEKISAAVKGQMAVELGLMGGRMRGLTKHQLAQISLNKLLTASWKSLSASVIATSKALLASPVTWITAALAALGSIIYFCVTAETAEEKALKRLNAEREKEQQLAEERKATAQSLISTMNDETSTIYMKEKAYAELVGKYPELLKHYTEEELKTKAQTDANRELLKSINDIEDAKARQSAQQRYDSAKGRYESYSRQIESVASTPNAGGGAIVALTKQRDIAKNEMDEAKRELSEIDRLRKEAEFNNAPTEVKIASLQENIDELKRQEKELDTLIAGVKQKSGDNPAGYFSSFLTEDALQEQKQANVKQQKEIEAQIADIQRGQSTTKNKSFWEKQKKDAESAIASMDVSQKGNAEWNKQIKLIREAEAALAKYNTTNKTTAKISEERVRVADQLQDLEMRNAQSLVSLETNDKKRREQEIEIEYLREKAQIEKDIQEFAKRNKAIGATGLNELGLTEDQQEAVSKAYDIAEQKRSKMQAELLKEDTIALREYLKEYGSIMSQKYAIAKEYEEKIAKESNESSRQSLAREAQRITSEKEVNDLISRIDWYTAFSDVGVVLTEQLKPLYQQMKDFTISPAFGKIDASDQEAVVSSMRKIREAIGEDSLGFEDLRDAIIEYRDSSKELEAAKKNEKKIIDELAKARKALESSDDQKGVGEQISDLEAQLISASDAVVDAENKFRASGTKLGQTAEEVVSPMSKITAFLETSGIPRLGELYAAFDQLKGGIDGLKALSDAADSGKKLGDSLEEAGEVATDALADGLSKAGFIGQIIAAILKILDVLKDGIGPLIAGIIDSILGAINGIIDNIISGQFIEQIVGSIIKGVGNIINTVTRAIGNIVSFGALDGGLFDWISGGNSEKTAQKIEQLTKSNEDLKSAIEGLKDEIANNYGTKTIEATQRAIDVQKRYEENLRQILDAQMGYHNSHHSNAYYWNLNPDSLSQINQLLGTSLANSWADFSKLTADQMNQIRSYLPDIWREMIGQGEYGARFEDDWNAYADAAGEVQELLDTLHESLTQISFDSLRESFIDTLMDMEANAQTFSDNFSEMFQRALLSFAIGDEFNKRLKEWYESFAKAMEESQGELSQSQVDSFRQQYEQMAQEALEMRDEIASITGYDQSESANGQRATSKGFQTMDQETGSELNGRFTDMQGKMAEQLGLSREAIANLEYIRSISEEKLHMAQDTRDIMIQMAGNVADIKMNSDILPQIHDAVSKTNKLLEERL